MSHGLLADNVDTTLVVGLPQMRCLVKGTIIDLS